MEQHGALQYAERKYTAQLPCRIKELEGLPLTFEVNSTYTIRKYELTRSSGGPLLAKLLYLVVEKKNKLKKN